MSYRNHGGRTLLSALLLMTGSLALAQPDTLWTNGTIQGFTQLRLIRTSEGGFAAGSTGFSGQNGHFDDLCLIKLDSLGNLEWQTFYPGTPEGRHVADEGWSIQQYPDEGYVITGYSNANGFIVRTDSRGELIWQKYLPVDEGYMVVVDCILTEDDGVIGVGSGFVVKLDRDGEVIWSQFLRDEHFIRCWGVCNTSAGGVLVTGESGNDAVALKLDSDGNVEWEKRYGFEELTEGGGAAIQMSDGGYGIFCYARDGGGSQGIFPYVVKTDSEGEVVWETTYDDHRGLYTRDGLETADGGFVLVGYDRIPTGYYLMRVGFDGQFYWQATFERGDTGNSVLLMEDGGYLVGGRGREYGCYLVRTEPDPVVIPFELNPSAESYDFGVVELDSIAEWEMSLENIGRCYAVIDSVTFDGGLQNMFICQMELPIRIEPRDTASFTIAFQPEIETIYESTATFWFGDTSIMVSLTGQGVPNSVESDAEVGQGGTPILLSVSPNPFNSTLTIRYATGGLETAATRLGIYDVNGREVFSVADPNPRGKITPPTPPAIAGGDFQTLVWNASASPAGIYFVRLQSGSEIVTQKVVLIR